ncbi:MAG TPA: hypothetical protein VNN17_12475, partial [Terriglobia bacterium]|nr:hypothetical protein [Terriglobia bacterium]
DARRKIPAELYSEKETVANLLNEHRQTIERLASLSELRPSARPLSQEGGAMRALPDYSLKLVLADAVDAEAERARLRKELQKLEKELSSLRHQLDNEQFLAKAPRQVVVHLRARREEVATQAAKIQDTLHKLGG